MNPKFVTIQLMLMLTAMAVAGQVHQPLRMEIMLDQQDNYFTVMSMKEDGIVMFREVEKDRSPRTKVWEVVVIDTTLQQVLHRTYTLDFKAEFTGYEYRDKHLYLLYRMGLYQKDDLKILKINIDTGQVVEFNIKQIVPVNLTEFTIVGNAALLGGYVNYRPALIHYDFEGKKIKVLPGIYRNNSELIEINVDEKSKSFSVVMTERTRDKRFSISVKVFDEKGELLQNNFLEPRSNTSILYGRTTNNTQNDQFIVGTYSHKRSNFSRGIYIARLNRDPNEKPDITYFNYGDLKNFFSYMKAKRAARVKERVERRKIKGKKIRFNYRLLVHDIIMENGNYLMIGEAFYPKYGSSGYYGGYGMLPGGQNLAFEGYKYTHAVIIAFDTNGKLQYDNSFEINDVLSYQLEQLVSVGVEEDMVVLLYTYENVIRSKIIQRNEVLEGKAFNDIKLKFEDDIVRNNDSEVGGLKKWYDDYFFAYGVQKIKNFKDRGVGLNREVFYINKITYHAPSEDLPVEGE
ncbi:MAG: hypothetical protein OER04_06180 [Cyclobacteriaceae bacterium]|nr:hypothetical protein [Cyclobacteriaceae bacterium]